MTGWNDFQDAGRFPEATPRDEQGRIDEEAMLRRLLAELAAGRESAPDLTDGVMRRLGFVRCTRQERRRFERAASLRRAAVMALMLLAALVGYGIASQRQAPQDQAIAPAVRGVLERHGRSFHGVMNGLPRWREPVSASPASMQVPAPGLGVVPVIFVPVHRDGCRPDRLPQIDPADDCPRMRRLAAQTPFPEV